MYHWIPIKNRDDFSKLSEYISPEDYRTGEVAEWLAKSLNEEVKGVLVEYPYVDKDYRSTYYNYYAKKGATYSPHCARLHFFAKGWSLSSDPIDLKCKGVSGVLGDEDVSKGYLGYLVVRPTKIQTIGRSIIDPKALHIKDVRLIVHRHKCHVMGYRVHVTGFPFMQQHSDIAVCAHTASWAILRHYSERYAAYPEVLLHDIATRGHDFEPGGLLPSFGLTPREVEKIFAGVGAYPLLVRGPKQPSAGGGPDQAQNLAEYLQFFDEMLAYLESGFPLFGVQTDRAHAVVIAGYRRSCRLQSNANEVRARDWDYVSDLVVIDDNFSPYLCVGRSKQQQAYQVQEFDAFIVPLPEKVFLSASSVLTLASIALEAVPHEFKYLEEQKDKLVVRVFIATTASWHRYLRQHAQKLAASFVSVALALPMPQFLWMIEYATPEQRERGEIEARLVVDATASSYDWFPAFVLHGKRGALWIDRSNRLQMRYEAFASEAAQLHEMPGNLAAY